MRLLFLLFLLCASVLQAADVEEVLAGMTLEEKVGQMNQIDIAVFIDDSLPQLVNYTLLKEWIESYKIGSILNSPFSMANAGGKPGWTAAEWREVIRNIQLISQKSKQDKGGSAIPIMYGIDSIHGASYVYESALFPQQLATAATFNVSHSYHSGRVAAKDTAAAGIPWLFSPILGLALNPLWPRFYETFGEDPYLAAQMGEAIIKGMQATKGLENSVPHRVAACMKHFIAYSAPVTGHDRAPVQLPDRLLKQLFLPSFQAAIDAGVLTAMEAYHEVDGVPMVSSKEYLTTLLRHNMKFKGLLVTDYAEIENSHNFHMTAATITEAVQQSLSDTTIDMSMVPLDNSFYESTLQLVKSGDIDIKRIDESVRRILEVKNTLGLLDTPIIPLDDPLLPTVGQAADWDLSLEAAKESVVLLKNSETLPFPPEQLSSEGTIFVTGPNADSLVRQTGGKVFQDSLLSPLYGDIAAGWTFHWQGGNDDSEFSNGVTVVQGLQSMYSASHVDYEPGPSVDATDLSGLDMDDVVRRAESSELVVFCLGEGSYTEKPGDITDLNLAAGQVEYMKEVVSRLNPAIPVVLVLLEGRPRLLQGLPELADAVVFGGLPGPMGGQAIAEILSGKTSPSGRLPFSYPKHHGSIPYAYHHKPSSMCTDLDNGFNNIPCQIEWPFGSGLSYSTFEVSDMKLSTSVVDEKGSVTVSAAVTNTGSIRAKYSVLLFINQMFRRVSPEYKLLKRFSKVDLSPGERVTLEWTISAAEDLVYIGIDERYVMESGEFRVGIGPSVDCRADGSSPLCATFQLQTSENYHPICDAACGLIAASSKQLGAEEDSVACVDQCKSEQWSWNDVSCLECKEAKGVLMPRRAGNCGTCSRLPLESRPPSESDNEDKGELPMAFQLASAAVGGALVGVVAMWLTLQQAKPPTAVGEKNDFLLSESLLPSES